MTPDSLPVNSDGLIVLPNIWDNLFKTELLTRFKETVMGEITGPFRFKGSLGNFRSYYNSAARKYVVATKGGATRDLIFNHPAFAHQRENMTEFGTCGKWCHDNNVYI